MHDEFVTADHGGVVVRPQRRVKKRCVLVEQAGTPDDYTCAYAN